MAAFDIEIVRSQLDAFLKNLLRAGRFQLQFRIEPGPGLREG